MIHYMPCSPHAQGKCMAEIFGNKIKFKQEIALASWQFETKLWTAHSFKTCWLHCSGNHFTPLCYFQVLVMETSQKGTATSPRASKLAKLTKLRKIFLKQANLHWKRFCKTSKMRGYLSSLLQRI